jgi:hypothetical protein
LNRIVKYQEFKGIIKNAYLKNQWSLYRPLNTNITIIKVNKLLNKNIDKEYLIKNINGFNNINNIDYS